MLRKLMQWFSKVLSLFYKRKNGDKLNPSNKSWKHMLPKDRPFDVFDVTDNGSSPIQQLFKTAPEITIPGNFYSEKGFTSSNAKKLTLAGDCYIGGYDSASFTCPNLSLFTGGNFYYGGGKNQTLQLDGLYAIGNVIIPNGKIKHLNVAGSLFCMSPYKYMNNGKVLSQTDDFSNHSSYDFHDGVVVDNDSWVGKDMKVAFYFGCSGNLTVCGHLLNKMYVSVSGDIYVDGNIGCSRICAENIVVKGDFTFFSALCFIKKDLFVGRNLYAKAHGDCLNILDNTGTITVCGNVTVDVSPYSSCDAEHIDQRRKSWYLCKNTPDVKGKVYIHQLPYPLE